MKKEMPLLVTRKIHLRCGRMFPPRCFGEWREDCEKQSAKRATGDVVVNVPAAKRQRASVPAEMPSTGIMATTVATPVKTTSVPPPLTSHQTGANHDADGTAETLVFAELSEETVKKATAVAKFLKYPELPGPHLVWGSASQKEGCWMFCRACSAWIGWARHDVGIDPDGWCDHYTEIVKKRLRVAMDNAAADKVRRAKWDRPPRFNQATLDAVPDFWPFQEGEVRGMMDH